jgi:hypothetical protein
METLCVEALPNRVFFRLGKQTAQRRQWGTASSQVWTDVSKGNCSDLPFTLAAAAGVRWWRVNTHLMSASRYAELLLVRLKYGDGLASKFGVRVATYLSSLPRSCPPLWRVCRRLKRSHSVDKVIVPLKVYD